MIVLQTQLLAGEAHGLSSNDCDDIQAAFDAVYKTVLPATADAFALSVCVPRGDGADLDYYFYAEPRTEESLPAFAAYLKAHDHLTLWGHRFDFRAVAALEAHAIATYEYVSASGPVLGMYEHAVYESFPNFAALDAFEREAEAAMAAPMAQHLDFVAGYYGRNQADYVRADVLADVQRIRLETTWDFHLEDGTSHEGYGRYETQRDCAGNCSSEGL